MSREIVAITQRFSPTGEPGIVRGTEALQDVWCHAEGMTKNQPQDQSATDATAADVKREQALQVGRIFAIIGAVGLVAVGIALLIVGPELTLLVAASPFFTFFITGLMMRYFSGRDRDRHR